LDGDLIYGRAVSVSLATQTAQRLVAGARQKREKWETGVKRGGDV
jgi:hypothetical protein